MILTCRYVYLASEQQDGKLEKMKFSFLEYYSYVFLFTNIIVGALPFSDFVNFMRLQDSYAVIKFNLKPAMISFLKAVLFSIGEILIRPRFDFNWFESQEWLGMNIFERHGLLLIIAFCARFKYFLAFKFTQAAMDSSGITFDGEDDFGRQLYTKNRISDYRFEIECNTYNRTRQWNSTVQKWLKVCFYDRIFPIYGEKTFYITFIVSALWHGFFLIYYLFFLEWAILNQVTKYLYKARNKFQIIPSPVKKFVQILYTHLVINAFAIPVVLLQWDRGVKLSNDLYWSAQIMVLSLFIFFYISCWGQSKENQKKKS